MFYLNVLLRVKENEDADKVARALERMRPMCLAEAGCVRWEAYRSESDAGLFILVERWASKEAWQLHLGGEALTTIYRVDVLPNVEREVHPSKMLHRD